MNILFYLQMAVVRMRDSGDKHGLQFQITIHGQNKLYTFQAARKEVRDMWIKEIGRLLQAQFSLMKGENCEGGRERCDWSCSPWYRYGTSVWDVGQK